MHNKLLFTARQSLTGTGVSVVIQTVSRYYPALIPAVRGCLAVFGAMALKGRTKPLSLIFEAASGYGKTAVLQMTFPTSDSSLAGFVYRTDKFTPKSFVTHAGNINRDKLDELDLLPKLKGKVLVTKELAPIFRGRREDMQENFSTLISVLDGKGFTSDSGMQGQRGYPDDILFNWVGATTPLPAETHRLMAQLGTRLLFYEVPSVAPTDEELMAYAASDDPGEAEHECNLVVNDFLLQFFDCHPVGSVDARTIKIQRAHLKAITGWAKLIVKGRAEIVYERDHFEQPPPCVRNAEGPWKVVNYLKELARGHALIHDRMEVNADDLELVGHVAISSIPGHLRPILRELQQAESVTTERAREICRVSAPTARKYLAELHLLGIADLSKGSSQSNEADTVILANEFTWLRTGNLES